MFFIVVSKKKEWLSKLLHVYFVYSNYITNCFEYYDITSTKDRVEINLAGEFYCLNDKDNVDVRVSSIFNAYYSNGVFDDDMYVWNINKYNVSNVNIQHIILRNYEGMVKDRGYINSNNTGNDWLDIIKIGFLVVVLIVLFLAKKKYQNNSGYY